HWATHMVRTWWKTFLQCTTRRLDDFRLTVSVRNLPHAPSVSPTKAQSSDVPHTGFRSVFDMHTATLPNVSVAACSCCMTTTGDDKESNRPSAAGFRSSLESLSMTLSSGSYTELTQTLEYNRLTLAELNHIICYH
ncbi:Hypothetical predicted protein, partial [Xyrichtys novacula]